MWAAYTVLTAVHLWVNYAAMRVLAFRSLNRRRLAVALHAFCHHNSSVPTPAQVAQQEVIVPLPFPLPGSLADAGRFLGKRLHLGARVKDLGVESAAELAQLQKLFEGEAFLLNGTPGGEVVVALREDATTLTLLKACLHVRVNAGGTDEDGGLRCCFALTEDSATSAHAWPFMRWTHKYTGVPVPRAGQGDGRHQAVHDDGGGATRDSAGRACRGLRKVPPV